MAIEPLTMFLVKRFYGLFCHFCSSSAIWARPFFSPQAAGSTHSSASFLRRSSRQCPIVWILREPDHRRFQCIKNTVGGLNVVAVFAVNELTAVASTLRAPSKTPVPTVAHAPKRAVFALLRTPF
jgi:hypothetical protein